MVRQSRPWPEECGGHSPHLSEGPRDAEQEQQQPGLVAHLRHTGRRWDDDRRDRRMERAIISLGHRIVSAVLPPPVGD